MNTPKYLAPSEQSPSYAELAFALESLRQENSQLRTALSSGLCSAHQEPDPLHCDMCNGIKCFFNANTSLVEENSRLREALEKIVKEGRYPGSSRLTAHIAEEALNPPKRS